MLCKFCICNSVVIKPLTDLCLFKRKIIQLLDLENTIAYKSYVTKDRLHKTNR